MRQMLVDAGFGEVKIQVKENAAEFIKDWMPGSSAEKYITSAYVTAVKPVGLPGLRDNVRAATEHVVVLAGEQSASKAKPAECAPGA
mmetsp:Transcript_37352/g.107656  ORF Transcript_37352/g.107656 Transcript_37352/m.107656 type:complete len:87 (-) Transcript_37352:461-721(-)